MCQRRDDAILERRARRVLDEVGERLRVGLGREAVALSLERGAQRVRVLDDAVVHQGDVAGAVAVRVGVAPGGGAVRGPAGVGDAARAVERLAREAFLQGVNPPGELQHLQPGAVLDRDAGRVVPAILQAPQPFQQDRRRVTRADIADDSAHLRIPP